MSLGQILFTIFVFLAMYLAIGVTGALVVYRYTDELEHADGSLDATMVMLVICLWPLAIAVALYDAVWIDRGVPWLTKKLRILKKKRPPKDQ